MNSLQTSLLALTLVTASFAGSSARAADTVTPPRPPAAIELLPLPPDVERSPVRVRVKINADGSPQKITVLSVCNPVIESRLLAAMAQWKFIPATKNGEPVTAEVILPLRLLPPSAHAAARL